MLKHYLLFAQDELKNLVEEEHKKIDEKLKKENLNKEETEKAEKSPSDT